MNRSDSRRFDDIYRRLWNALHVGDRNGDLGQHERQLLAHVPAEGGISLSALAAHLLLPKSSASVAVRKLADKGLVVRVRRPDNERELAITLTPEGRRRVADDAVLDPRRLAAALRSLPEADRAELLRLLESVAAVAEKKPR